MPIRTGRNGKPPPMNSEPKVKRGTLPIGSWPTTVINNPMAVEISPLRSEDSVRPATIAMASTNSEKYSHGPNSSAIAASGPVRNTRNKAPSRPPRPTPDAQPDGAARLAVACHWKAVERGGDRRRRARDPEQAAGDEAAGRSADIDPDHRRKARQRIEPVGERQHHDHRHGDGDARQRAADHADERAGNSGNRYFHWAMLRRPCQSKSSIRNLSSALLGSSTSRYRSKMK